MISCTEFIPAYSEFFKYIDQKSGRQAVYDCWNALFQPGNSPLDGRIAKYGRLAGCWENWYVVYTEEACDNTMLYNEEEGWLVACMHHCPSKGRFKKLGYMEPFEEYCKHCDGYDIVFKKHGVGHVMDYRGNECAKCREVMYDPDKFKGDPQQLLDTMYKCEMAGCKFGDDPAQCPMNRPGTKTLHTTSEAYKYLHPDFHCSMARCMKYCYEKYGEEGLREYLTQFTLAFHKPLIAEAKEIGLAAGFAGTNCQRITRLDEIKPINSGSMFSSGIKYAVLFGALAFVVSVVGVIVIDRAKKWYKENKASLLGAPEVELGDGMAEGEKQEADQSDAVEWK